ncbi:MAG: tRNA uracil 4-sulfurtransferase ThiI [Nitrospinota bacterium]|jgi:thiamine biosynthesis protein ThiI|nr:tRNA uracil 4-sulfurtransferase ThiI [Nitrospinota bacterium]
MRCVIVHYHEIALKKGNRPYYIERLAGNLRQATSDLAVRRVRRVSGRLVMELEEEAAWETVRARLAGTFGIANFSLGKQVQLDLDSFKRDIGRAVVARREAGDDFKTFRVAARRAFKQFPLSSPEINREVGAHLQELTGASVNLSRADLTVHLEVIPREAFFYFEKVQGPGGLPVGVSGHVCVLLSGGIDSPVAAYRMLQRGCQATFVHFHGAPYLSKASAEKAMDLAELLTCHQHRSTLYSTPFGEIQRRVVLAVPPPLRVILYRRLMLRIAEALGRRHGAQALVTGESLAQVASQTLTNIGVIEEAADLPIFRPLIGMDKNEISAQSERIGTYETSIQPDQDCCSLFVPKHPATRCRIEEVRAAEGLLDMEDLVSRGVGEASVHEFHFPEVAAPERRAQPAPS